MRSERQPVQPNTIKAERHDTSVRAYGAPLPLNPILAPRFAANTAVAVAFSSQLMRLVRCSVGSVGVVVNVTLQVVPARKFVRGEVVVRTAAEVDEVCRQHEHCWIHWIDDKGYAICLDESEEGSTYSGRNWYPYSKELDDEMAGRNVLEGSLVAATTARRKVRKAQLRDIDVQPFVRTSLLLTPRSLSRRRIGRCSTASPCRGSLLSWM